MISNIELHLRSSAIGQHRCLGVVAAEHQGSRLTQNEDIACWVAGRRIHACVTAVHRCGGPPRVYADEVSADELVG